MMAAKFDNQQKQSDEAARSDPFSRKFDGGNKLKKGDAGYGRAVVGSQTEERARKAQEWVEVEIEKLLAVIRQNGEVTEDGKAAITFGVLFNVYADISDTLVGILMRARKRKKLSFESDMLFQGVHDQVLIRIL